MLLPLSALFHGQVAVFWIKAGQVADQPGHLELLQLVVSCHTQRHDTTVGPSTLGPARQALFGSGRSWGSHREQIAPPARLPVGEDTWEAGGQEVSEASRSLSPVRRGAGPSARFFESHCVAFFCPRGNARHSPIQTQRGSVTIIASATKTSYVYVDQWLHFHDHFREGMFPCVPSSN